MRPSSWGFLSSHLEDASPLSKLKSTLFVLPVADVGAGVDAAGLAEFQPGGGWNQSARRAAIQRGVAVLEGQFTAGREGRAHQHIGKAVVIHITGPGHYVAELLVRSRAFQDEL